MNQITAASRAAGVATDPVNREKDDFYPTPPEAVEALLSKERFDGAIWEPACGDGAISKVLKEHGHDVESTDLVDRGYGVPRVDFLMEYTTLAPNIITNPPFKNATDFARHSCKLSTKKVAFLCRINFLEGVERKKLFEEYPLARVWIFSYRLQMWRGNQQGVGTSMFCFAWFVWDKAHKGPTELGWL